MKEMFQRHLGKKSHKYKADRIPTIQYTHYTVSNNNCNFPHGQPTIKALEERLRECMEFTRMPTYIYTVSCIHVVRAYCMY